MTDGGWLTAEVAAAQRALVERELQAPDAVEPYVSFLWAMDFIAPKPGTTLLDAGCGVGHYGVLLRDRYPRVRYIGTDYSEAMIDQAQKLNPKGTFGVCDFADNAFGESDIILAGQVVECQEDRWAALGMLLARAKHWVILHRIRLTGGESHPLQEATYSGHVGETYLWNLEEITRFVSDSASAVTRRLWNADRQATFVAARRA